MFSIRRIPHLSRVKRLRRITESTAFAVLSRADERGRSRHLWYQKKIPEGSFFDTEKEGFEQSFYSRNNVERRFRASRFLYRTIYRTKFLFYLCIHTYDDNFLHFRMFSSDIKSMYFSSLSETPFNLIIILSLSFTRFKDIPSI